MPLFVALSIALAIAVFALMLRPIWREKPLVAITISIVFIGGSIGLYRLVGTPEALDADNLRAPESMADAVAMLERKMADTPEREGFVLLAEAYAKLEMTVKARDAWERALAMTATDMSAQPSELAAAAEARMLASENRRFDMRAVDYLERALKQDPQHQRARFFLGLALRQQGKAKDAATTWEPLLAQLAPEQAVTLRKEVDAARLEVGLPPLPSQTPSNAIGSTANDTTGIRVTVALDPDFAARARLRGDASVFVIARVPNGPPMPVAVEKHPIGALPLQIVLDDSDSPMPTAKLSGLKEVELVARLSESGNAIRQDGDLESKPVRVVLPAKAPIALTLGARAP